MARQFYHKLYRPFLSVEDFGIHEYVDRLFDDDDIESRYPEKVKRNLELYICNLLQHGTIAIPQRPIFFTQLQHEFNTYAYSKHALTALLDAKFITIRMKGYRSEGWDTGFSTVFESTDLMRAVFNGVKIPECSMDVRKVINNNNTSKYNKDINHYGTFQLCDSKHDTVDTVRQEMEVLNLEYITKRRIGHHNMRELGIFSNACLTAIPTFRGDEACGLRMYQRYGESFQQLPSVDRRGLTIDGVPTAEVDYNAIHVNLLYNLTGAPSPKEDPYNAILEGLSVTPTPELRKCAKNIVMVAINAENHASFKRSYNRKKGREVRKVLESNCLTVDAMLESFKTVHEPIAQFLNSDIGVRLQLADSNILRKVLFALKDEGIASLPLHDSIICQKGNECRVAAIMKEKYEEYTGYSIGVSVK